MLYAVSLQLDWRRIHYKAKSTQTAGHTEKKLPLKKDIDCQPVDELELTRIDNNLVVPKSVGALPIRPLYSPHFSIVVHSNTYIHTPYLDLLFPLVDSHDVALPPS